jgi:hypothetical protein
MLNAERALGLTAAAAAAATLPAIQSAAAEVQRVAVEAAKTAERAASCAANFKGISAHRPEPSNADETPEEAPPPIFAGELVCPDSRSVVRSDPFVEFARPARYFEKVCLIFGNGPFFSNVDTGYFLGARSAVPLGRPCR